MQNSEPMVDIHCHLAPDLDDGAHSGRESLAMARMAVADGIHKVVVTPHLGASTGEAQLNVAISIAEQVRDFLLHGSVSNAVNMPSVSSEEFNRLQPFLALGERLGAWRAARHIDVHRNDAVDAGEGGVVLIEAPRAGTDAEGHDPLRLAHLLVDLEQDRRLLLRHRADHHKQVGLSW